MELLSKLELWFVSWVKSSLWDKLNCKVAEKIKEFSPHCLNSFVSFQPLYSFNYLYSSMVYRYALCTCTQWYAGMHYVPALNGMQVCIMYLHSMVCRYALCTCTQWYAGMQYVPALNGMQVCIMYLHSMVCIMYLHSMVCRNALCTCSQWYAGMHYVPALK